MREERCAEDKLAILMLIIDQMGEEEIHNPPNVRNIERSRTKSATALRFIETKSIRETNRLLPAGAIVVAAQLGVRSNQNKPQKKPWWKRRIESKIKSLRKDISRLDRVISG